MKLLVVGDSFTYGEELSDKSVAWPFLLANKLNGTVDNLARPGSGNTRMIRQVLEYKNHYDLAIVAWSHYARIEFADDNGFYDIWPGCRKAAQLTSAIWRGELIDYINRYHNDEYLFNEHIINVILLQNYFKNQNKKFLMLESFSDTKADLCKQTNKLVEQIDKTYYVDWPNTMMEWTWRTPQGANGHFLDEGHNVVANKVYEHIKGLSWAN